MPEERRPQVPELELAPGVGRHRLGPALAGTTLFPFPTPSPPLSSSPLVLFSLLPLSLLLLLLFTLCPIYRCRTIHMFNAFFFV